MRSPTLRTLAAALGGAALVAFALASSCFAPPPLDGPFACGPENSCPDPYTCDDGVCCIMGGAPECPSYVLPDGGCPDGGAPRTYFQDLDQDGYGANGTGHPACRAPVSYHYSLDGGDCDDSPATGAAIHPGAVELCDGLDNDCNGQRDDGLPQLTFWRDQDLDGYGDPAGAVTACQSPPGYVTNNADCQPDHSWQHPGATEICNGQDDDCNQVVDDIPEQGQSCTDTSRVGICQQGTWQCSGTSKVCQQSVSPQPVDVCDGLDNNCNGVVDERPDCGGPSSLALEPGVVFGAKKLSVAWFSGTTPPPRCLRDDPAATPSDQVNQPTAEWQGYNATTHVLWAQAPAGKTWDLTQAGKALRLLAGEQISSANYPGGYVWHNVPQPWVMLCGPAGFVRLERSSSLFSTTSQTASFDESFPVRGGGGSAWSVAAGSSANVDAVLRQVEHVEILVEPELASGGSNFYFDFSETRTGFP